MTTAHLAQVLSGEIYAIRHVTLKGRGAGRKLASSIQDWIRLKTI